MLLAGMRNWLNKPAAGALSPAVAERGDTETQEVRAEPNGDGCSVRVAVTAQLWGEGFALPGGEAEVLRLASPLGVSAESSLMVLGGGPGGAALAIADHLGVGVTGFEAEVDFVAAGSALCAQSGRGGRVQMARWDPAAPRFERRSFHHAVAFDPVRGSTPETVLGALALALRSGGQIALTQIVADAPLDRTDPLVRSWGERERRSTDVPAEVTISRVLGRLGFEVRVAEDISQRHVKLAVRGWRDAVRAMQGRPAVPVAAALVDQAEAWLLRIRLMRAGKLRLVRWHAIHRVAS